MNIMTSVMQRFHIHTWYGVGAVLAAIAIGTLVVRSYMPALSFTNMLVLGTMLALFALVIGLSASWIVGGCLWLFELKFPIHWATRVFSVSDALLKLSGGVFAAGAAACACIFIAAYLWR